MSSQEKREGSVLSVEDKPDYPSGLRIHLNEDTIAKLGLSEMPEVGAMMNIIGMAEVVNVSKEDGMGDVESFSISLQIQDLDVNEETKDQQVGNLLYGGEA